MWQMQHILPFKSAFANAQTPKCMQPVLLQLLTKHITVFDLIYWQKMQTLGINIIAHFDTTRI